MSENPSGVVRAVPADEIHIFETLKRLHEENGMWPMNEKLVQEEIMKATRGSKTEPAVIGLLRGEKGDIQGMVWLLLVSPWYSDWYYWSERLLYVVPEHRRSTHAKRLIAFAKWCADSMTEGVKNADGEQKEIPLLIGIQTFKSLEPKMRLYQRSFNQVGALFQYRLVPQTTFNQRHVENGHSES